MPGQSLPKRSGVGRRQNIMGAVVYWRENTAGAGAPPKYELRAEVIKDMLKMWDGSTQTPTGKKKQQKTLEPEDYVSNTNQRIV